ncbi:4-aminobutyrate--2-oxoglutarate transaminase [Deinococcus psychrotolerans]|uniref:4-aminobutyrate--2-oxoglutarate transaminase n=1 Tax=Deinococcus psychrotolerans TaxID=2489213 RepID=A0A3G8YJ57_9DEIO|nr:4-aminobutyrate--2-oxoglutarate transaminase [Deinococcus psychrotolerans]AZI44317.1 4-aminobutyrate--2-oxoglutarate transaminase [Deinococcus psychrotolerans]
MTQLQQPHDWLTDRQTYVARGVNNAHPVVIARAENARVWDITGREYIDFVGGIGVLNVGHNHPRVVAAIQAQAEQFLHPCFQVALYPGYIELCRRLCVRAPIRGPVKGALFSTGAEATENAVKMARSYTGRSAVISLTHSFHGRTLMGMSLTGKASTYKQNFGPFAPEVYHTAAPYSYRGVSAEQALDRLDELLITTVGADQVAAIIVEPVLGEGGFLPLPAAFLRGLRERCTQHGMVLIADEIQSGVGRTGTFFAIEHSGTEPDLVLVAKSLGGGLPISAVIGKADIVDAPAPGGLGGTYAGNPLACAAANAVLDLFDDGELLPQAAALGEQLRAGLDKLAVGFPQIGEVRGIGAMLALELVEDPLTKTPATALTQRVVEQARERGLLLLKAGLYGNVIRVLVPLTATPRDIHEGLLRLEAALEAAVERRHVVG